MQVKGNIEEKLVIFKQCPMCATVWKDRGQFIGDRHLELDGYQADFENLGTGLFYFTHKIPGCCSTMAMEAENFFDLHRGERYRERRTLTPDCPQLCLSKEKLERCPIDCECAFVREVIGIVRETKKNGGPTEL